MGSTRPCVLLVPLLLLLVLALSASTGAYARSPPVMVGGWSPISNLADPDVREIADFAIAEHNKKEPEARKLLLKKIVSGKIQTVEGFNYDLVLEAKYLVGGAPAGRYDAQVWDGVRSRQLTSFKSVKA